MASTWERPEWVAIARRAAAALDADHDVAVRAILAHWQCEQPSPAPWPPIHRNPGNLTRRIGSLGGPPPAIATTAPGAGLLYVYPTPEAGAAAYARYLLTSARYRGAIHELRIGSGAGFLSGVCRAGYGTRETCCLHLYAIARLPPPAPRFHRFRAQHDRIRIRHAPSMAAAIVGYAHAGQVVSGPIYHRGTYHRAGRQYDTWIELSPTHWTSSVFYDQLP